MSLNNNTNKELKNDIQKLNDYSELVDRFFATNSIVDAIQVTRELIATKIETSLITTNFDNSPTLWMTRLFARIFEIKEINKITLVDDYIRFNQLSNFEFSFVSSSTNQSGFYLRETNQVLNIMYFDIVTQRLFFNANALAKMISSAPARHISEDDLSDFVKMMNLLSDAVLEDEFALDLNIIDYENDQILYADKVDIPVEVTDKLFLTATKNGFYVSALDNGFEINLDKDISLFFVQEIDNGGHAQWHYRVLDKKNEWSFLQILQKFPFIGNWYIQNLNSVEVAYRDEIFIGW